MPETCRDLMSKANAYVSKKASDWPEEVIREALRDAKGREYERMIDTAALANDIQACAAACRAWWKVILSYAPKKESVHA